MSATIQNQVNTALQFHQKGEFSEAAKLYLEILELAPDNSDTLNLLGLLKLQQNQFEDAIFYIKRAIDLKPCAYFYVNLGTAYSDKGNNNQAIEYFKKALEYKNNDYDALFNLAFSYKQNKEYEKALETYKAALATKPNQADIYFNIGNIYENQNETASALEYYKKALEYRDDNDNHYFLAIAYLKTKNFEEGFKHYEHRPSKEFCIRTQEHQLKDIITTKPLWAGEDIKDKTLFVYYEAGLGDTLMYARYIPILKDKCAKILFKPQLSLVNLFKDSNLNAQIIDINTPEVDLIFDVHIPLMSIPYVLQLNSEEKIPYKGKVLFSNPEKVQEYKEKYFNNDKFKIGIKWEGNPHYDRNRIIPIEAFYKLFNLPNTQFYSLQKGEGSEELEKIPKNYDIIDLGPTFNDFTDTAAAVENLDLVICNDTSVAHLVGAMGKPCWVLLPFVSNWRWHNDYSYSPWYDSVKLFKQNKLDNWDNVFDEVYENLNTNLIR